MSTRCSIQVRPTIPILVIESCCMTITLLTYNIRGELWTKEASEELARVIKERKVDVVCLQEVVREYRNGDEEEPREKNKEKKREVKRSILKEITALLEKEYKTVVYLPVQSPHKSVGNAILYKKDKLKAVGQEFSKAFPKISQRSLLEEWGNQFMLPIRRIIMSEKFELDHRSLIVYNVHLDYFGGDTRRIYQLQHFFDLWGLQRHADGVIEIVAGDFNTWSPGFFRKIYRTISILRRWLRGKEFKEITSHIKWTQIFDRSEADRAAQKGVVQISFFEKLITRYDQRFKQKLDHIWVRGDVDVVSCERLDLPYSDHFPILAQLTFNETADAEDN
jgi:endonuclease/exonuclease/phosphatase family metal-dependent hydrolase